ncbi:MAG: hypothetical protein QNI84_14205 [Henriciella sp.]|nr:hypothetical protein [Henriciella sp.]
MRRPGNNKVRERFSEAHSGEITIRPARRRKSPPPYSIRFTEEERAILKREAGSLSEAAYIRKKLFEDQPHIFQRLTRKRRAPNVDHAALAQVLGQLGQSRLPSNLNQIAKAANIGALPVTPDLEEELREACRAIFAMKAALQSALGMKTP